MSGNFLNYDLINFYLKRGTHTRIFILGDPHNNQQAESEGIAEAFVTGG